MTKVSDFLQILQTLDKSTASSLKINASYTAYEVLDVKQTDDLKL